ncbi:ThuA domain-containing protein [Paenibacillus sp. M1]|uniref:ThuA domain-containing protein n=1 Tax=Paenibacillus haidiansis TaxID=1574488 RepID=A0ABU7VM93_9BACL
MEHITKVKPKALLIGDYTDAPYHPLGAVEGRLRDILEERWTVEASDDYDSLHVEEISRCDLCISYADRWELPMTDGQTAGLLAYIAGGGGLLALHNGISLQARPEAAQMLGARFTGHPAYRELDFRVENNDHPVTEGIRPFTMPEEPYRFDTDHFSDHEVLLTYRHEDRDRPAAWARRFGLGRIVYLMPGHHIDSFRNPEYAKLLLNGANWAGGA